MTEDHQHTLSMIQKIFKAILPASLFEAAKKDSQQWKAQCSACGYTDSVWQYGEIKYGSAGQMGEQKYKKYKCKKCGVRKFQALVKD